MNTSNIRENINIKIEQAKEAAEKGAELCTRYVNNSDPKYLKHMGGYLGTCVNNLRSALNYATNDYCQQRGFLTAEEKKISTDFPYSLEKVNFDKIKLVLLMSKFDPDLYDFIERLQPYHKDTWLGTLMKLSNMDKHKILVDVQNFDISTFVMLDDKNRNIPAPKGKPVRVRPTPCYVDQLRMFALPNGKWLMFMFPVDDHRKEFFPYITTVSKRVEDTINEFYKLFFKAI